MPAGAWRSVTATRRRLGLTRRARRAKGAKSLVDQAPKDRFAVDLTLYLLARFALVAVITVLLVAFRVPVLVALIIAMVVGFPLGLLLFRSLAARVTAGLAARGERRRAEREKLRAQLRGDVEPDDGPAGDAADGARPTDPADRRGQDEGRS
uniref:DUF4229 domain-containing protein n=1 Tax=Thermocrispum agreste TaxID=37925 RepID=A0A2W4L4K5_9PSEU|nr:MAG: DUF4229 domain-containing protein [Thermocrispum agreste]